MKCLQCGKEISEGRKFCSSSCSAKYNNARRVRKPWTEEQKKAIQVRVDQVCKYCGQPTGKQVWHYSRLGTCKDCAPYVQHLPVFRKLNISTGTLKQREKEAFTFLKDAYYTRNLGLVGIVKETGIRRVSLLSIFRANGIDQLRTKSEGVHVAWQDGKIEPVDCLKYKRGEHTSWEGKTFHYRSSYELDYANLLDAAKIRYDYEPKFCRTEYFDSSKNKMRVAVPDFYLPDSNELVEVKSTWTLNLQEMRDKVKAYMDRGYGFRLILDKQEVDLTQL